MGMGSAGGCFHGEISDKIYKRPVPRGMGSQGQGASSKPIHGEQDLQASVTSSTVDRIYKELVTRGVGSTTR
jgi:hypothetical protein